MQHLIFSGFQHPSPQDLDRFKAAGARGVIVGINNEDDDANGLTASDLQDGFAWRHGARGPELLRQTIAACAARGLECWPMIWARPSERYNREASEALEEFLGLDGFAGLVHDAERYWHKLQAPARLTPEQSAALWRNFWDRDGLVNHCTDYASLPLASKPLLASCQGGIPQAYSRRSWSLRPGKENAVWKAGNTQSTAGKTWLAGVAEEARGLLWCGLGAYDLGPNKAEWMAAQLHGARAAGFEAAAWWSWPAAKEEGAADLLLGIIRSDAGEP